MNSVKFPQLKIAALEIEQIETAACWLQQQWQQRYATTLGPELSQEYDLSYFRQHLQQFRAYCWLAWYGPERLAGLVCSSANAIEDLWVEPRYQRRGIGQKLLEHSLTDLQNKGYRTAQIGCENFNRELIGFLQDQQWKLIASEPMTLQNGQSIEAQVWSKKLPAAA